MLRKCWLKPWSTRTRLFSGPPNAFRKSCVKEEVLVPDNRTDLLPALLAKGSSFSAVHLGLQEGYLLPFLGVSKSSLYILDRAFDLGHKQRKDTPQLASSKADDTITIPWTL